jgi:adenosylmethionine-8-amino-7-oxononanoate aminotransferase
MDDEDAALPGRTPMTLTRDEILELDRRHVWHPYTAVDDGRPPLVIVGDEGARLYEADGRVLLDGNSSWWAAGLGHRHPRLVRALIAQAERLGHVSLAGITHEPAAALGEELARVAPPGLERVFYSDDGSTAIEAALKLAVQYFRQTGRPSKHRFMALRGAFHGETLGASSLGGVELFRSGFGPLVCDVIHVPSPAPEDDTAAVEATWRQAFARAAEEIARGREHIAAVVVEPLVQGAAGMQIYAPAYLAELRRVTAEHDVLLIADEVFTGYGRTGTMWACEKAHVVPDLLCLGKTFSGGLLPMAATLVGERLLEGFRGGRERAFLHGHSFCGNPLGAAVAREVLVVLREEAVLEGVQKKAPRLAAAVTQAARLPGVRRPRHLGMVAAVDLADGGYLGNAGWRVYEEGLSRGAYLRPLGVTVYLAPPLNIDDADLDRLCTIFVESIAAVMGRG